jgi:anti-sigma28 factor (negative regulator of flagellin synthesis)
MKIEQPHVKLDPASRVGGQPGQSSARATTAPGSDAVRLSSDLRLADQAVRAVSADSDRPDAVARGRALVESGTLGGDVERLADRMIDALLHSDDSPA